MRVCEVLCPALMTACMPHTRIQDPRTQTRGVMAQLVMSRTRSPTCSGDGDSLEGRVVGVCPQVPQHLQVLRALVHATNHLHVVADVTGGSFLGLERRGRRSRAGVCTPVQVPGVRMGPIVVLGFLLFGAGP